MASEWCLSQMPWSCGDVGTVLVVHRPRANAWASTPSAATVRCPFSCGPPRKVCGPPCVPHAVTSRPWLMLSPSFPHPYPEAPRPAFKTQARMSTHACFLPARPGEAPQPGAHLLSPHRFYRGTAHDTLGCSSAGWLPSSCVLTWWTQRALGSLSLLIKD